MRGVDYKDVERLGGAKGEGWSTQSSRSCYCTWAGASEPTLTLAAPGAALPVLLEAWG